MMFAPPSFEPNTPREPQWFPRPITDSIESSLDLIERLEEDRKRRLRNIANVPARVPIGLGGVEDRSHANASGSHQSPKPNSNSSGGCNDYARYRYYPPLDAVPSSSSSSASVAGSSVAMETPYNLAALHNSYTLGNDDSHITQRSMLSSSVTTRNRVYRRGATPRSSSVANATSTSIAANALLAGGMNDGEATELRHFPESETPHQYLQQSGNQSFYSPSSSMQFTSPPLDPRAGGGRGSGRRVGRTSASSAASYSASARRRQQHHQLMQEGIDTTSDSVNLTGTTDWITPPAMTEDHQTPGGHGQGDDVYSQRRDASQRRRRRWWDEVNNDA